MVVMHEDCGCVWQSVWHDTGEVVKTHTRYCRYHDPERTKPSLVAGIFLVLLTLGIFGLCLFGIS